MSDLICASSLSRAPELIADCGGDADAVLARVGIDPSVVGAYDRFIPFTALSTLVGVCAAEFGVPDFGLRLAARQDPDILGPLAIAARHAETMGDGLREVTRYTHVYSPALATELREHGDEVSYVLETLPQRLPYRSHVVELAMGVTLSACRMFTGPDFRPTRVAFDHQPIADRSVYLEYFRCPVEFDAPAIALTFPRETLRRRLPRADPLTYDVAIRAMAGHERAHSFTDAVSALIVRSLPAGASTLDTVAELLMMHPRSVQRALAESGTTFDRLVDDARRDIATTLLANPGVSLSAVARQIGYSEQSTLTRSCRRWFGMPPLRKRRALLGRSSD
ncbi:AraC family transcriptional regulator [Gordonia hydrophobica]|uniref:AraC family transcriptional regulator n=1 Tax=Gordonia hydrophobica TaxID=40516 RepID=A0ABZ2TZ52_9ACTN|nr:AraC family transcriptional regulator [Gordonia hydrophobica]MBM7366980.1 AraC-like DNA-binding protein [Gordonia hydrophobica]